ncbi:hypothetical protein VSS74_00985 [Conexibacter stalactiti]|uniref:Uncharacterized protein n=1 Tax=Conexibacter stalactiti TaxID=1940611 RepID=A0ABU4HHV6_9ACTN|nr:hypothetical protein [Conexibacter stalactiti]MDW5592892.1 hypothetical protein [Conexibacter stalactiti]MEC5033533.1 hypothetical protein [Conexibacter stalactiti]
MEPRVDLTALEHVTPSPALRSWVEAAVAEAEAVESAASHDSAPGATPSAAATSRPAPPRRRRSRRPLALAGALACLVVVVLAAALLLSGGDGGGAPSVPQVAPVALRSARAPAPAVRGDGLLAASIDGVAFPAWASWRATGERSDRVEGREVRTVFYANRGGDRVGYAIVGGDALPFGGRYVRWRGIPMWVYELGDATAVMWLRDGRTCIVAGRGVGTDTLLALAGADTRPA